MVDVLDRPAVMGDVLDVPLVQPIEIGPQPSRTPRQTRRLDLAADQQSRRSPIPASESFAEDASTSSIRVRRTRLVKVLLGMGCIAITERAD
jgi:hypothetical protein